MNRTIVRLVLAAVVMSLGQSALAQETVPPRAGRPYRGLFGGGIGETEHLLTATASVGGGFDDSILADAPGGSGVIPGTRQLSGGFAHLSAGLSYSLNRTRAGLSASLSTSGRYVPSLSSPYVGGHAASVGASLQITQRTQLVASQSVSRYPYISHLRIPDFFDRELPAAVAPDQALASAPGEYWSQASAVGLSRTLGRRVTLDFNYGYMSSDLGDDAQGGTSDLSTQSAGGRVRFGLTRDLGLRLGYAYVESDLGGLDEHVVQGHNLDAGIDFTRALSISRRTTLSFSTGSAALVDRDRTYYRVTGDARLNREIGRTWNAAAVYSRGLGYVETFDEPFFSDSIMVGVSGLMNRRLQFSSAAGASFGDVGLTGVGNGYDTFYGSVGLSTGLTRNLAVGVDYSFYRYAFDNIELLPAGMPPELNRQSVTAYVSVWAPLLHRARRTNASR